MLVAAIAYLLLDSGAVRFNYPDKKEFPVQGIDISHHQKAIRWDIVKNSDIKFVVMKATEGGDFRDRQFKYNWKHARKQGFIVGAYHFFTFCRRGTAQARNFIQTVPKIADSLPPVVDFEFLGGCNTKPPRYDVKKELRDYLKALRTHYKKEPILYVTHESYSRYISGDFKQSPIWIRDIFKRPTLSDSRHWLIWQFTNRGKIEGIKTHVDINVFNGSYEDLKKLTK
jgi:lysozyme